MVVNFSSSGLFRLRLTQLTPTPTYSLYRLNSYGGPLPISQTLYWNSNGPKSGTFFLVYVGSFNSTAEVSSQIIMTSTVTVRNFYVKLVSGYQYILLRSKNIGFGLTILISLAAGQVTGSETSTSITFSPF